MPFVTQAEMTSLDANQYAKLIAENISLGSHHRTGDRFLVSNEQRESGMYIIGKPGMGKSGELELFTLHDMYVGNSVFLLDPHGDSIRHILARMPEHRLANTFLLDIGDEKYPFGINVLSLPKDATALARSQALNSIMHAFEVVWPDSTNQLYLPLFLRAATVTLFDNPGSTLLDMYRLITDEAYRELCVSFVKDPITKQFWHNYNQMTRSEKNQQILPIKTRLESLFMGRPLVRNIIGQTQSTLDFRKSIVNREIMLFNLPLKTLGADAKLIGALIIAQLHTALFAAIDTVEEKRPSFSLYVDEFQNFASPDLGEMFTEGRKFKIRVCLAHQYRKQLNESLRHSTLMAGTIVCFQTSHEDAVEMAHSFVSGTETIADEDIDPDPISHLLQYGANDVNAQRFIDYYLRALQSQHRGGEVEIKHPGTQWIDVLYKSFGAQPPNKPVTVPDPKPYLNHLLYEVMKTRNASQYIEPQIFYGFSNIGRGFYSKFFYALNKQKLLRGNVTYPSYLVVNNTWTKQPSDSGEELYCFLFHLQATMQYLSANPIGKKKAQNPSDIARMLTILPKRAAFVRSGTEIGQVYTDDSSPSVDEQTAIGRYFDVRSMTRYVYCREVSELDSDINVDIKTEPPVQPPTKLQEPLKEESPRPLKQDEPPFSRWEEV